MKIKTKQKIIILVTAVLLLGGCAGCSGDMQEKTGMSESGANIQAIVDLEGKCIGTQIGSTGVIYAENIKDAQVQSFTKPSAAVKALKEHKIDAVIIDSETAKALTEDDEHCKILSQSFMEEEYSIAYSKNNTELGNKIDNALVTLQNNGTLDEITKHWIGENADQLSYQPDNSLKRNGTITMATNAEFPPYESTTTDGEIVGVDVDIMMAVCDQLKMELNIRDMQFDSILPAVQNGKADVGVAGISVTPEREQQVSFTQSYAASKLVIIVRNE